MPHYDACLIMTKEEEQLSSMPRTVRSGVVNNQKQHPTPDPLVWLPLFPVRPDFWAACFGSPVGILLTLCLLLLGLFRAALNTATAHTCSMAPLLRSRDRSEAVACGTWLAVSLSTSSRAKQPTATMTCNAYVLNPKLETQKYRNQ